MEPRRRRSGAWRILGGLGLLLILFVGGLWLWINSIADRQWNIAEGRMRELCRNAPEAPRLSDLQSTNEVEREFLAALLEAGRRYPRLYPAHSLVRWQQNQEMADEILGQAHVFLEQLHTAARRCATNPAQVPPPRLLKLDSSFPSAILNCSVLRARRARQVGDPVQAAEAILDLLHLTRYFSQVRPRRLRFDWLNQLSYPLEELRDVIATAELTPADLTQIERELEMSDRAMSWPLHDLEGHLADWVPYLRGLSRSNLQDGAPYRWRFLLPERLMKAEALLWSELHVRRVLDCDQKPYSQLAGEFQQIDREMIESKNPILRDLTLFSGEFGVVGFRVQAQLRVLRVAAHYRANGELLTVDDPYGTVLLHAETATGMKFWSLGRDGKDDGGDRGSTGRWDPSGPIPGQQAPRLPTDVVIEAPRRP